MQKLPLLEDIPTLYGTRVGDTLFALYQTIDQ